jgi:hypothetical protein
VRRSGGVHLASIEGKTPSLAEPGRTRTGAPPEWL